MLAGLWGETLANAARTAPRTAPPPSSSCIDDPASPTALQAPEFVNLSLAYAVTVHKAQGGESRCVVLVISHSSGRLLNRRLLYTGEAQRGARHFCCGAGLYLAGALATRVPPKRNSQNTPVDARTAALTRAKELLVVVKVPGYDGACPLEHAVAIHDPTDRHSALLEGLEARGRGLPRHRPEIFD